MNNESDQFYANLRKGMFLIQRVGGIKRVGFIGFGVDCMVKEVGEPD